MQEQGSDAFQQRDERLGPRPVTPHDLNARELAHVVWVTADRSHLDALCRELADQRSPDGARRTGYQGS